MKSRGSFKRGPVLVPIAYQSAIDRLSKSHLADLVWSLAGKTVESAEDEPNVFAEIRAESAIVSTYRRDTSLDVWARRRDGAA